MYIVNNSTHLSMNLSKFYRPACARVTILAFIITHLFPPFLRAAVRQSAIEHSVIEHKERLQEEEKKEMYYEIENKLMEHPWLTEFFDENSHQPIIDSLIKNFPMASPLGERLGQLHGTGQLDERRFRAVIDELAQSGWTEKVLGTTLFEELMGQIIVMEEYLLTSLLDEVMERGYRVVRDELVGMGKEGGRMSSLLSFDQAKSTLKMMFPFFPFSVNTTTFFYNARINNNPGEEEGNSKPGYEGKSGKSSSNNTLLKMALTVVSAVVVAILLKMTGSVPKGFEEAVRRWSPFGNR